MSILGNAVSSIQLGIDDFRLAQAGHEARALSAIRNLTAGLLLLFKVQLQEMSPAGSNEALLKARLALKVDDSGSPMWVGSGGSTVDVDELIRRLDGLGVKGIDWARLRQLQKIRNDVEHYYTKEPIAKVLEAISASFHLIQQFVPVHLNESPVALLGEDHWYFLVEQQEFYDEELAKCREALSAIDWPLSALREAIPHMYCMQCQSELVRPVEGAAPPPRTSFLCTKCDLETGWDDFVQAALGELFIGRNHLSITQGGEAGLDHCDECGEDTYVIDEGRCAACLAEGATGVCGRCHADMSREEIRLYGGLCNECNYQFEKAMRDD